MIAIEAPRTESPGLLTWLPELHAMLYFLLLFCYDTAKDPGKGAFVRLTEDEFERRRITQVY